MSRERLSPNHLTTGMASARFAVVPAARREQLIADLQRLGYEVVTDDDIQTANQTASLRGVPTEPAGRRLAKPLTHS